MSIFSVVFLYLVWSSVFPIGKWTLQFTSPIFLTCSRMLLAGAILLSYWAFKGKSFSLTKKQLCSLFILSFLSIYLTNILEFWGLQYLTAGKTCFIYSLSPFFAALFSYLHFNERMTPQKWIGMGVGFLGFLPVLYTQVGEEGIFGGIGFLSWPSLAIMGAALASVYGWVLLRLVVKDQEVSPIYANGSIMILGGFFALIHSFFVDSWNPLPVNNLASFSYGMLTITLFSNLICYNLYGFLLKKFTATFLSFMGLLSPIFASLTSWVLIGERPSWVIFLSTAIVSSGLWLIYRSELRQGYIVKKRKKTAKTL